jgi:hypothetical protein
MEQPINRDETSPQDGSQNPSEGVTPPMAEGIGEENKPNQDGANRGNKGGGLKKWVGHLWSRDPDRQLELILALAIAFFSLCQLVITIINNISTSAQVDKIIATAGSLKDSAGQIKDAGWVFSGAAQGINNAGWNAVARLQDQANKMEAARRSSEGNSKLSLDAAIRQSHLDERGWLGFVNVAVTLNQADPIKAETTAIILGKSPVANITTRNGMVHYESSHTLEPSDLVLNPIVVPNGTAMPGGSFPIKSIGSDPISDYDKLLVDAILQQRQILYYYGETDYRDVFNKPHWSHFCYVIVSAVSTDSHPCKIYNDTDADHQPEK